MAEPELLGCIARAMATVRAAWMVTGSVAAIGHGVGRNTHDIDIVIELPSTQIQAIMAAFPAPEFYIDEFAVRNGVLVGQIFNVLHQPTGVRIDFWPLKETPFDMLAFDSREFRDVEGQKIPFIRADHLILQKLHWCKLSGGSERQFSDCVTVYELRARTFDHAVMDHWAMRLGVTDLLSRLRAEAEPL